jgi:RNA polymerase sigma-70 factor (ECF subfamily)
MTRDEDAMLVQACLEGDHSAFDLLVDRYEGALFNAAYRITGSVEDAMDATQAAFVNAFEKLHTFDSSYRFFSWIYRIACNQALNLVGRRRPRVELDADHPDHGADPEAVFTESEAGGFLQRALMELTPQHRVVIVLKHLQGLTYREIAELLEIPEKTVKSRLFTARQNLRSILLEKGFVP